MLIFYTKYVTVHVIGNTVRHFCLELCAFKNEHIDIDILNYIHGDIVLSIENTSKVKTA